MRKVRYCVGISLDGYVASADGSFDWLNRAVSNVKGEDFGMGALFKSIDTVLMGRKTYEVAVKMGGGGYPNVKNYVFSRTLPPGERKGVEIVCADPSKFVAELKKRRGKDIYLSGGGELARELLRSGAVDQIELGVVPVLVGGGLPCFPPGFQETDLELINCKQYKGGILGLTYRIVRRPVRATQSRAKSKKQVTAKRR